jgi:AAA domain
LKRWLIKGVIAKGETSSWIGPPGGGKSALLTDLSIAVAAGCEWRGYRSKDRCGIVYFAFERADLVKRRLSVYSRRGHKNLPIAVRRGVIDLLNPNCVDRMLATIRKAEKRFGCDVGMIVIDTYSKGIAAGGGDENTARDQNKVAANLQLLHGRKALHIAAVGHTGKDETRGARGSNAHMADVDLMVQVSKHGTTRIADVTKANDQPEGKLTTYRLEIVQLGIDEDGDPMTTAVIKEAGDEVKPQDFGETSTGEAATCDVTPEDQELFELLANAIAENETKLPRGEPHMVGKVIGKMSKARQKKFGASSHRRTRIKKAAAARKRISTSAGTLRLIEGKFLKIELLPMH